MLRLFLLLLFLFSAYLLQAENPYFTIRVIDEETKRGIPLVELKTVHQVSYYTDSNGLVAFYEPGLMGKHVFFHVQSHGYSFPKDGFGYAGKSLFVESGKEATLEMKRINVAQRLYRVTGQGIYRDSVLVGAKTPIDKPLLNALVTGQDTVMALPYQKKIYWFWGDTNRLSYPLGNFGVSGAVSEFPAKGFSPQKGVNFSYFINEEGFSRKMCPFSNSSPVWIEGLMGVPNKGGELLVAQYEIIKTLGEVTERGLVAFDDKEQVFQKLHRFEINNPLYPRGHPFKAIKREEPTQDYFYFSLPHPKPYPNVRVKANLTDLLDPNNYEVFTCLSGSEKIQWHYQELGELDFAWRKGGVPWSQEKQAEFLAQKKISLGQGWIQLQDHKTGQKVRAHAGSVYWNSFRQRWILIAQETEGESSFLGEIWYAEADTVVGPWAYAQKIVTHKNYTFYNPTQHPFFDKENGRLIYFEGTYTNTFTRGKVSPTPRYDYNQIMYQLDLADLRLFLPTPIYRKKDGMLVSREQIVQQKSWDQIWEIAFFALPPQRQRKNTQALFLSPKGRLSWSKTEVSHLLGYATPKKKENEKKENELWPTQTILYCHKHLNSPEFFYTTNKHWSKQGWSKGEAFAWVWKNPFTSLILDRETVAREK